MVTVEHLTKYYGDVLAVDDLSFEIGEGNVYGLLGPNGAGKSTTMNIMTGCLSATEGKIIIDGHDIMEETEEAKKCIGYLPEQPPLYVQETPLEYLKFVGEAKGLRGDELYSQIDDVKEKTGIENVKDRLISALSKGYKQRVGIAQALLGNPSVIILDEPTVGLDPIQIIEIRDLIKTLGQDHTVILSSHILSEVQVICEKVMIISKGKLVAFDSLDNLEKLLVPQGGLKFSVEATKEETERIVASVSNVTESSFSEMEDGCTTVDITTDADNVRQVCRDVFFAFANGRHAIYEMTTKTTGLEDVFIELTEKGSADETSDEEDLDSTGVGDTAKAADEETAETEPLSEDAEVSADIEEPGDDGKAEESDDETETSEEAAEAEEEVEE